MLQVVKFMDGRYGIQNTFTGIILADSHGRVLSYKTPRKALKKIRKKEEKLMSVIHKLQRKGV